MYLRASDKVSGVENFYSAVGNKLIRRDLIAKALHQGLAPHKGLEAEQFQYAKTLEKPLVVGVLGTGRQGLRLLAAVNPAFVAVQAIFDIRPSNQDRAIESLPGIAKAKGDEGQSHAKLLAAAKAKGIGVYGAFDKKSLEEAAKVHGLDAVIIALPTHLHAAAALAALDAGLHVFVESPLAKTVDEAKDIARKAAEKNLILAVGQQRHYSRIYDHALEMVRLDLLDNVHYIRAQWHVPKPDNKPADAAKSDDKKKEAKKANEFAIDWWQPVPAGEEHMKFTGYGSPLELVRWQLYEKYSGGLLAELGSQLFGAAAMFVAANPHHDPQHPYPLNVVATGSQTLSAVEGDIDDHVHCIFEYAIQGYVEDEATPPKARKKIAVQFDLILGNEFDGYGETVLGRMGSLVLESEQKAMLFHTTDVDKGLRVTQKKDSKGVPHGPPVIEVPKDGKADEDSQAYGRLALQGADASIATELEHWAFCCTPAGAKAGAKPRCGAEAGLYATVLAVAAAKAIKLGRRVDFDKDWFNVASKETPDELK